jgi:N-acetylglucosamine-6-phosphate deacetylase
MTTLAAKRVVTPSGMLSPGVVETDGERIVAVAATSGTVPDRTLAPGFIDLQVNGINDIDVAAANGPDWHRLDELLLDQGVTAWCPTLVTAPLPAFVAPLARMAAAAARPDPGSRPLLIGAHLEGPFLGGAPGAHPKQLIIDVDLGWINSLPPIVKVVTLAPEAVGAVDAIKALVERGVLVSIGHSTATYEEAEAAVEAGARLVTHLFNGMAPLHHRTPGVLGAALSDERLTTSLIADLVHVHPAAIKTAFRAKGRRGIILVTDAVAWQAARVGRIEIALRDGAPRLPDGTLAGSALRMDQAVKNVVDRAGVSLEDAIAAASTTPAMLAALQGRGRLEVGARADIVAVSPKLDVEAVWLGGQQVRGDGQREAPG